jgi:signal peptidase II
MVYNQQVMKLNFSKETCVPLSLTGFIILLDQLVKSFVVKNWPLEGSFIKDLFGNSLVQFFHVRNKAIAFSLGHNLPDQFRPGLFIVLPLIVLLLLLWYYFNSRDFCAPQRWAVAGIVGGGLGNIIDRIFRPDGVVDYISVKFFGIFGMDRWPTFNIADASVVICCGVFFVSMLFGPNPKQEKTKDPSPEEAQK